MAKFLHWPSKKAAKAFFRSMLDGYSDGDTVTQQDAKYLMDVLAMHPEAEVKIGCGVKRLYKDKACFWLERLDGTRTDFSYRYCISGKPPTLKREFLNACRQAVRDDLMATKGEILERIGSTDRMVKCSVTGKIIPFADVHLDHAAPMTFEVIVKTFLAAHKIKPEDLSPPGDKQWVTRFTNKRLEQDFPDYHNKVAVLRIVSSQVNLRCTTLTTAE